MHEPKSWEPPPDDSIGWEIVGFALDFADLVLGIFF